MNTIRRAFVKAKAAEQAFGHMGSFTMLCRHTLCCRTYLNLVRFLFMIRSFADRRTQALARGEIVKGIPTDVLKRATNKLFLLDTVTRLDDLRVPPGNRLEALSGTRAGQHSIRVNDQWRLCFVWASDGVHDVVLVDYH